VAKARLLGPPVRERFDRGVVAEDQCFLLHTAPTLKLSLRSDSIGDPLELLGKDKRHGTALRSVAAEIAQIMLADALLEVRACRADVIRTVGAAEHVDEDRHISPPPYPSTRALRARAQDEEENGTHTLPSTCARSRKRGCRRAKGQRRSTPPAALSTCSTSCFEHPSSAASVKVASGGWIGTS